MKTIKEIDNYCRIHNKVLTKRNKNTWIVTDTVKVGMFLIKDNYKVI